MEPLLISKERVAELLPMQECIEVMEKAFIALASQDGLQPLRSLMWLPDKKGLLGMMPGYSKELGVMGIKIISVFPENHAAGYPSHQGVIILFDAEHGQPLMSFDAGEITAIRTAAASAVATKILARQGSRTLAILGAGEQARRHIEAMLLVRDINDIRIWSRSHSNANKIAEEMGSRFNIAIRVSPSAQEAIHQADIICTVTSSALPIINHAWIAAGTHINAVGSSTPGKRELDSATIVNGKLFTDRYESIFNEAGDFLIPKKEGLISDDHVVAEIGELLTGTKKGREHEKEITIFKSLGIAAEDIFSAWHIWQKIKN